MLDIKIKEEFKSLIPSLTAEEYEGLEASIIQDGCRDRIVTWKGYIIDGHNRYEICKKHNIAFEVSEKDNFATEADVKLWMIENQFSRRNLPIETRMKLAYRFKEIEAEKAKLRQSNLSNLKQFQSKNSEEQEYLPDAQLVGKPVERGRGALGEIAKMANVSHTTAEQYDTIQRKGTEEQKAQVDSGQYSIKKVYTQIQKAERLAKNEATGADVEPDKILASKYIEKLFLKHFADKYLKNNQIRYVLLCENITDAGNNYFQISNCTKEEVQSLHSQCINGY